MPDQQVLTYTTHDLALACYQVREVCVDYAGSRRRLFAERTAPAKTAADALRYPNVKFGSYPAFAGPLQVRWCSQEGDQHALTIELDRVFPGRVVPLGDVPARLYQPMPLSGGEPTIIVELLGRTLNLYLFATVQLAPDSGAHGVREERDVRALAFSHTC